MSYKLDNTNNPLPPRDEDADYGKYSQGSYEGPFKKDSDEDADYFKKGWGNKDSESSNDE